MRERLADMGAPDWVLVLWDLVEMIGAVTTLATIYRWFQSQQGQLGTQPA